MTQTLTCSIPLPKTLLLNSILFVPTATELDTFVIDVRYGLLVSLTWLSVHVRLLYADFGVLIDYEVDALTSGGKRCRGNVKKFGLSQFIQGTEVILCKSAIASIIQAVFAGTISAGGTSLSMMFNNLDFVVL